MTQRRQQPPPPPHQQPTTMERMGHLIRQRSAQSLIDLALEDNAAYVVVTTFLRVIQGYPPEMPLFNQSDKDFARDTADKVDAAYKAQQESFTQSQMLDRNSRTLDDSSE